MLLTTSANPVQQRTVPLKEILESWFVSGAPVTEVRLSPRFLRKLLIFLPGLTSLPTSFVTLRRSLRTFSFPVSHLSTSIALRSQFHFCAESPRCGGRHRFRRFPIPSTKSLFGNFLSFLFPRSRQHLSDFVFVQGTVALVVLLDEFLHIFQVINSRVFVDFLPLLPLRSAFPTRTLRETFD